MGLSEDRSRTDRRKCPGHTLQPTALVHEAYLRLVDAEGAERWNGRAHFFGAAAEAMRRILVDSARRKQSAKRGGGWRRTDGGELAGQVGDRPVDLLALDDALSELERRWPDKAKLVKLRHFVGMTIPEAADALGVSRATAERHWTFSRAWLHARLGGDA